MPNVQFNSVKIRGAECLLVRYKSSVEQGSVDLPRHAARHPRLRILNSQDFHLQCSIQLRRVAHFETINDCH